MSSASHSLWSPLRLPAFRGLWTGSAIYFTGNAMQVMAASWLMVELTGSSFLAALVQTAVFLPMFLLALPAGVLADTSDRRAVDPPGAGRPDRRGHRAVAARHAGMGRADVPAAVHLCRGLLHGAAVAGL